MVPSLPRLASLLLALGYSLCVVASAGEGVLAADAEIQRQNNQSLLWGPYKSNLYFGVRPRLPKSLWAGLMWVKVSDFEGIQNSMYQLSLPNNIGSLF